MAPTSRRSYNSPRRIEAARETRRAVLAAARQQFVENGYAHTTLAAIAEAAGVSVATVKLVGGTKPKLLVATIQAEVRRDDDSVPLAEQQWWRELLAEPDSHRMLKKFAAAVASTVERQSELFAVVWQAAAGEPEIASLDQRARQGRWNDLRVVAQALAERGALRPGLDLDTATDIIWALASPQLYRLLTVDRKWSTERWGAWLSESLTIQLLTRQTLPPGPSLST